MKCRYNFINADRQFVRSTWWDLFVSVKWIIQEMSVETLLYIRKLGSHAMTCCVVLPLRLVGKSCSLLGYRSNKWRWTSQGGESARWWAWCSFPINVEGLILVPWSSMLGCHLTNTNYVALLSIIISSNRLYPHCICELLARVPINTSVPIHHVYTTCQYTLYNATFFLLENHPYSVHENWT